MFTGLTPGGRQFSLTKTVPFVATMIFVVMVAIGERQIRTSRNWPPPPRHELGAWETKDPPILNLVAGLNLPASVPIFWMWAHNDAFAYAFDDHQLIVYLPWVFFVFCLWYFVAYRLEHSIGKPRWKSRLQQFLVLFVQAFITLELLYVATAMRYPRHNEGEKPFALCLWAWLLLVAIGWVDVARRKGFATSQTHSQ